MRLSQLDFVLFVFYAVLKVIVDLIELLFGFVEVSAVEKGNAHFPLALAVEELFFDAHVVGCLPFGEVEHFNAKSQRHWHLPFVQLQNLRVVCPVSHQPRVIAGDLSYFQRLYPEQDAFQHFADPILIQVVVAHIG